MLCAVPRPKARQLTPARGCWNHLDVKAHTDVTRPRFEAARAEEAGHSMAEAAIAASAAICVAVLGALLSFIYSRQLQRRQARLERLNAQLRDFYGPLYAIFQANHIAHLRFVDTCAPAVPRLRPRRPTQRRRTSPVAPVGRERASPPIHPSL